MKNKNMKKEDEIKTVVPTLRFPEFITGKYWYISKIKDIYKITRGLVLAVTLVKETKDDIFIYPVYSSQTKNGGLVGYYKDYLYENAITWTTDGANAGDVNYRNGKFYCTNVCGVLLNQKGFSNKCMAEIINSVTRNYVSYVGNPKLMNGVMGDIIISVPPTIEEQQKIADCLSSLDELIEATIQKVETLKEHKKGLMQRLFPAEGNNLPDLRFPEFKGAEEWKGYKLKSLCEIGNGKDYKHLGSGNIPLYGSGGYMTSVDDFLYDGESVCIGRKGTIDKPIFLTGKFWTVDTLFYTHSFHNCLPKFLYLIFQQINWYKYNEAGGVPSLSKTTIGEINVFVPVGKKGELKEQQKITDCLFSLDELIEATSRKVEILKEHKKGLMQQLFPKI